MEPIKKITVVISDSRDHLPKSIEIIEKIEAELPVKISRASSIEDLFPLLSNHSFNTDYIAIEVEKFYELKGAHVFDIIHTLYTLIQCTVHRDDTNKVKRRDTKIVAMVSDSTPRDLIKEIISFPEIEYISIMQGNIFTREDVSESVRSILKDGERVPQKVQDLLKVPRKKQKNDEYIVLTPRQKQVFNMVLERGASNKIIAKTLRISESTVKLHMSIILKKYKVRSRTQLAVFAKKPLITV